jgi:hypothetical protein
VLAYVTAGSRAWNPTLFGFLLLLLSCVCLLGSQEEEEKKDPSIKTANKMMNQSRWS